MYNVKLCKEHIDLWLIEIIDYFTLKKIVKLITIVWFNLFLKFKHFLLENCVLKSFKCVLLSQSYPQQSQEM